MTSHGNYILDESFCLCCREQCERGGGGRAFRRLFWWFNGDNGGFLLGSGGGLETSRSELCCEVVKMQKLACIQVGAVRERAEHL